MGEYTAIARLYKTAADEVVDVEQQLNYNWDIADLNVKRLLEYEYTTTSVPDVVGALSRSRFYKEYSNSFLAYFTSGNFFWQDPVAKVTAWTLAESLLSGGYVSHPDFPLAYRRITTDGTTEEIEWTGAVWLNGALLPLNTNTEIITAGTMPASIRPDVSKYWQVSAGNTSADYSVARLFFGSPGDVEFKRYGSNASTSNDERRIEFTGVKYNVEVAA